MNSNKNNKDTLISYNDISTEEELAKTRINIIVNKNYKVKLKYNEDTGFIYKIIVDMENN